MLRFLALVITLLATASLAQAAESEPVYERLQAAFDAAPAAYDLDQEANETARIGRCFYRTEKTKALPAYFLALDLDPAEGPINGGPTRKIGFVASRDSAPDFFDQLTFAKLLENAREANIPFFQGEKSEKDNALLVDIGSKTLLQVRQDDTYVYVRGLDAKRRNYLLCYFFRSVR